MAITPLASWLRRNPTKTHLAWVFVGLMPFLITIAHLVMSIRLVDDVVLHHTQGMEFSVLDALVIALYFSAPRDRYSLPFRPEMAAYFLAVTVSLFQSIAPEYSLFILGSSFGCSSFTPLLPERAWICES